jgi:glycopeptide antibiotics resistance protein
MVEITYAQMLVFISVLWLLIRGICFLKNRRWVWKRELSLLLVYICIIVVVRFTFCPFGTVNGKIQPLLFDSAKILPFWLNLKPIIYLFDYPTMGEALLNLIGNTAMFIPLGIVWPAVFKKLNTHGKVIAAGFGVSLTIEILQLPFFDRATDVDDLLLNTLGFLVGYGIYLLVKKLRKGRK